MAATMIGGAKTPAWGSGTAGAARNDAPSRRQLAALLALASCASLAGAGAGAVRNANERARLALLDSATMASTRAAQAQAQTMSFARRAQTLTEQLESAQARAAAAEAQATDLQRRLEAVASTGFLEELADARQAERLGVALALGHAANMMPPDDQRRVLAAIVRAARRHGLDPLLLASVIQIESHFNPYAISSAGARGLMQLMPDTARWLLERELKPDALYNGPMNIELGSSYLRQLMDRFDGDLSQALVAYNAGPSVARSLVRNSKSWRRLQVYPQAVLAEYRRLTQLREDAGGLLARL
jgi:soluble lytic murein transglycosylase-like protein